jgi:predicted nucleotide-binding protein (sugar kinase/HSP70/actin superfamily)
MSTSSIGFPEGAQTTPLSQGVATGKHFRRPQERPFTADERETTTILMGGLTRKHDKFIEAVFHGSGYKCQALPTPDQAAFHVGKEYGNNGQCSPAYFTCGSLIQYLRDMELAGMSRSEIVDRFVFFTAGSCGPCRFSAYAAEYRLSLRNAGFDGFRVIRFQQDHGVRQKTEEPGLKYTIDLGFGMLKALYIGDVLNDITHNVRPFEVNPGETNRVMDECVQDICDHLRTYKPKDFRESAPSWFVKTLAGNKALNTTAIVLYKMREHLKGDEFLNIVERCHKRINAIDVDRLRVKPIVKIIGEFWAQTTEGDGNYRMFEFLEREGAHVQPEALGTWIKYLLTHARMQMHPRRGMDENYHEPQPGDWRQRLRNELRFQKQRGLLSLGESLYTGLYHKVLNRFGGTAHRLVSQYELAGLADPFYDPLARGGEGYLEVGKNIYYHSHKLCHMVLSLKPFGCMPSSQSDGIQSAVINRFRDMIFLPIETSGEGEVNAHSRVQMALGEAKAKAKAEFQEVLEKTGKNPEEIREFALKNPVLRRPMYKVPHHPGIAGSAANFVLHVSNIMSGRARLQQA